MSKKKETKRKKIEAIYNYINEMPEDANIDIENQKKIFFKKIDDRKKNYFYKYLKYAAVIAVLISSSYFLTKEDNIKPSPQVVNNNSDEIQVGTDKAILTLEDGSEVALEKGKSVTVNNIKSDGEKLVYQTSNSKNHDVKYNYLTIPRGGQFFIQLSDGTNVWLNSDSKLKYPVAFTKNSSRKVELVYGEAYFDVSPSKNHNNTNFIVSTQNQDIEVLGTQFNIRAYKEDNVIATTLVEGKVSVNNDGNKKTLKPNQQSQFNTTTNIIDIIPVDVYYEISWKNGLFSFKNKPLKDIMMVISRWYDVDVVFENEKALDVTFNGVFNKKQSIDEILSIIENTNEAKFETKGKTVFMK